MMEIGIIRICLDALGVIIAVRLVRRYLQRLKEQFVTERIGPEKACDFSLTAARPCTIKRLRIGVQLGQSPSCESRIHVYFDIQVSGDFGALIIKFPFEITYPIDETKDRVRIETGRDNHMVLFVDERQEPADWESPNCYISGEARMEKRNGRLSLFFPIRSVWAVGIPHSKGRVYPVSIQCNREIYHPYVPEIEKLEINILNHGDAYTADALHSVPRADVLLRSEMRWYSGSNGRAHSSILASFVDEQVVESSNIESYKNGVLLALSTALALSVTLDILWTAIQVMIDWIKSV